MIAVALKRYGVINADNGSNWFISGSTDRRWNDENLNQLKDIPGSAFEVVRRGRRPPAAEPRRAGPAQPSTPSSSSSLRFSSSPPP